MPIDKKGVPEKIEGISVVSGAQFDRIFTDIVKENKLIRCPKCRKLLSKKSDKDVKTLQHRGLKAIIRHGEVMINCIHCGTIVDLK